MNIPTTPSGPILPEGQIGKVEILGQEWVKPRVQDILPTALIPLPQCIWIMTNQGYLLLAQVERHTDRNGNTKIVRTLVEIQELNEAS